jgi:hypothetical protein
MQPLKALGVEALESRFWGYKCNENGVDCLLKFLAHCRCSGVFEEERCKISRGI